MIFLLGALSFLVALPVWSSEAPAAAPKVDVDAMILVEAGGFNMGVPFVEMQPYGDAWFIDQTPEHYVNVSEFYMDATEVTVADFAVFLNYAGGAAHHHPHQPIVEKGGEFQPFRANAQEPVRQVTWKAADAYCKWAGKRLPTEAEHEFASAGNEKRRFAWGETGSHCGTVNWFSGQSYCHGKVRDVASYPDGASPEGSYDLTGNVAEWVSDNYGDYQMESENDPQGPEEGTFKVIRGGSFLDAGPWQRTTARYSAHPDTRSEAVGFRCVYTEDLADDVTRGALEPAKTASDSRGTTEVGEAATTLASGLIQPLGLTVMDGIFYATEKNIGTVAAVDPTDGHVSVVAEGFETANYIANDGTHLYLTDTAAGAVYRVSLSGAKEEVAVGVSSPTHIVADANHIYFAASNAIFRASTADLVAEEWASDLDGVENLTLAFGNLYFVEAGTSSATNARVVKMNTTSGLENVLVANSPSIGTAFVPRALAVSPDGNQVYFPLQYRNWPWYAFPCSVPSSGGAIDCKTYSPPQPVGMQILGDTVYWGTRFTVTQFQPGQDTAFSQVKAWTRPGTMLEHDGQLVWVDQIDGRLYGYTPEN